MNNTFGNRLETIARLIPDKLAIIHGDNELTWKELDERVNRLSHALLGLSIK